MAKETANDAEALKRGAYPYTSLQKVLEVGAAISELGGDRAEVQKSVLAHRLNLDESGAAYTQTIGSAKCYGIIGGRGSYMLTEVGKEYFFPTQEGEQRRALLKMLKGPEVYDRLIARFDGSRLPAADVIANIVLRDYGVSKSWAPRVASLFASAIRDGGAVDSGGFVRYAASMIARHNQDRVAASALSATEEKARLTAPTEEAAAAQRDAIDRSLHRIEKLFGGSGDSDITGDVNVWQFRMGDSAVKLETSRDLSPALWHKLNQYVQVLRPSADNEEL